MSNCIDFFKYKKKKKEPKVSIGVEGRSKLLGAFDQRQSPHPEMGVYANKGEIITCEGTLQHEVAEFLLDVCVGQLMDVDNQIGNWRQRRVLSGAPSTDCVCEHCGHRWYDGWGSFHVKAGWRF